MNSQKHNEIVSFIWSIANDVLRDVFTRGKYRDIILPFTVIRRIDALLEPTKKEILETYKFLKKQKIDDFSGLTEITGYEFYNISNFTLRDLLDDPENIDSNLEKYLDGFDPVVQEIINKFRIKNHLDTLEEAGLTYNLLKKLTSKKINLSPEPSIDEKGNEIPGLSNLGMGYVFEELIRKFNEENNEEAGEHFTPRDIVELMTKLIFEPIKDKLKDSGTYQIYDPACGTGGMLTEAEKLVKNMFGENIKSMLYGQEINPETYAICTADMLIKNEDPKNIYYGSTLSDDGFADKKFDFMITNPPYGKSWDSDYKKIVGPKKEIKDTRFIHGVPRKSDGQLLFLSNMVSKMKQETELGSRIASIHNGSALFTGGAGQGESEIRRWIIEKDYLEAIIALPERMFYNTGISTYIFILSNRKPENRKGKIQLIDATKMFSEMRKSLGNKSRKIEPKQIQDIIKVYQNFEESEISKIFDNQDFGYQEIAVERPLRLKVRLSDENIEKIRFDVNGLEETMKWMYKKYGDDVYQNLKDLKKPTEKYLENNQIDLKPNQKKKLFQKKYWQEQKDLMSLAYNIQEIIGDDEHSDFNKFKEEAEKAVEKIDQKVSKSDLKKIYKVISQRDEKAKPVIKKETEEGIEYEADTDLRDKENVPLKDDIEEYFKREVLPYVPDAWIDKSKTKVGYEINFNKYFYKYDPLRDLDEIRADILKIEEETDGLLEKILDN